MSEPTLDDLFKTTFKCLIPYCAKPYNTRKEAKEHILSAHGMDEEPFSELHLDSLDGLPDFRSSPVKDTFCSDDILINSEEQFLQTSDLEFLDVGMSTVSKVLDGSSPQTFEQTNNLITGENPLLSQRKNVIPFEYCDNVKPNYDECEYDTFGY